MPIDITNMNELDRLIANVPDKLSPKTFDSDLTGSNNRLNGLFNRDFHSYGQIRDNHDGLFTTYGGQVTNSHEPGITINSILNFKPELMKSYNQHGVIRNKSAITALPLIGTLTRDDLTEVMLNYQLSKPLSVFSMDDMNAHFTKIKTMQNQNGDKIHVYGRFIVNTVHTFTYNDTHTHKPLRPYKFESNITPLIVYTTSNANNLSQSPVTILTHPDTTAIKAQLNSITNQATIIATNPQFISGNQFALNEKFCNDALYDTMYMHLRELIAQCTDQDLATIDQHSLYEDLNAQCNILPQALINDVKTLIDLTNQLVMDQSINHHNHKYLKNVYAPLLITAFAQIANYLQSYLTADDYNDLANVIKNANALPTNSLLSLDLRLLLADRLQQLNQLKNSNKLYQFRPTNNAVKQRWQQNPNYSNQQKALIRTKSPLVVGTAGAGSGKTHTVTGRLDYLKQQGEDLSHVLCLSFTNTAVTNIKNRYPKIQSKTLASLFDDIYTNTFTKQQLSNPQTLANVIQNLNIDQHNRFFANTNLDLDRLRAAQYNLVQSLQAFISVAYKQIDERSATISLLNTINSYLDECICILDAVQQTTLQLEPVIVYAYLLNKRQLNIPDNYQNLNFIIADESQDISTFEYILLLDLTKMYHSNLMIIGDGSQTLYEFRNANPMFMNTLEASTAFKTYHLTTNYRSNKAILMYANEFLNIIDANKYAKIQLQPNAFTKVTSQDFNQTIKINDFELEGNNKDDLSKNLMANLKKNHELEKWICDKYRQHEKIALIAYKRLEANTLRQYAKDVIQRNFNRKPKLLSLNPDPTYSDSSLTTALNNREYELSKIMLTPHFIDDYEKIINESILKTQELKHVSKPFIPDYVVTLFNRLKHSQYINRLLRTVITNQKPKTLLHAKMKRFLIDAEVKYNNIRQSQLNNKHREFIEQNLNQAEIITSTIHSVKGLEFDNTVVYCYEPKVLTQEEARMYMVALTRAKSHEYILNAYRPTKAEDHVNVSTDKISMFNTPMSTAYQRIITKLP